MNKTGVGNEKGFRAVKMLGTHGFWSKGGVRLCVLEAEFSGRGTTLTPYPHFLRLVLNNFNEAKHF